MSGIIGHTMYGVLAWKEAKARGLAVTALIEKHLPSFLCGAYLGCDIQIMPEALCIDTGKEVGLGTVPLEKSPITGGPVHPWTLEHAGVRYRPTTLHQMFYGRSHLIFGWTRGDALLAVPWDHLADYCALAVRDGLTSERGLAYALGWMVHIVGDSLIKSHQPGLQMRLLDGLYTPKNRIVQDQFTFHAIGAELGLDWEKTLRDLAATPVEPLQAHYMRIGEKSGELGKVFGDGWKPEQRSLLDAVLAENRRWLPHHMGDVLQGVKLVDGEASEIARRDSGGLDQATMLRLAEEAGMRNTLVTIADQCADLMERVIALVPEWKAQPRLPQVKWSRLGV